MQLTNHESNEDRLTFVGYVLTIVATLYAVIKVAGAIALNTDGYGETGLTGFESPNYGLIEQLAHAGQGNQLIGLTLIGAAFLLIRRSDASLGKSISLTLITVLSAALILSAVTGIANEVFGDDAGFTNDSLTVNVTDYISSLVLGVATLGIAWPFASTLGADEEDADTDETNT
jgi:hypothetical protein